MESKKLIKKSGLYFIGSLSSKILPILLLPIHANKISTSAFGDFDYAQTIMNIAAPIAFIAIWEAILKFIMGGTDKKEKVVATSCIFTFVMATIFALCTLIIDVFAHSAVKCLYYTSAISIIYAFMFIWQYYARALGHNKVFVLAGIIGAIVNFVANIVLIYCFDLQLDALFLAYIAGNLSIFLFIEFKIKILKNLSFKNVDFNLLKKMLVFSAPLVLNHISTWLITYFGRFVIKNYLGADFNGIYAYANKFAIIITMLGSVINMAIIEEALISARTKGIDKSFEDTFQGLFRIFQSIIIPAAPVIAIYYFFIRSTDYYISMEYFPLLLLYSLVMIMTTSIGTIFQVIDKTKYQFITTAMGSVATVFISLAFIKAGGLYAVVIGQLVGSLVMLISRYIFVNRHTSFKLNWVPIFMFCGIYLLTAYICVVFKNVFIDFIILFITSIIVLLLNKNMVIKMIQMIKKR